MIPSVSDASVICRVIYFQFPILVLFCALAQFRVISLDDLAVI